MAEYKQVDLQIGTEAQFESKKENLPIGTIVGITDPIHKSDLDSDLQVSIDSIADKLDKPSGNPTEDSFVKVSSTGSTSYQSLATLVDLASNQTLTGKKTWTVTEPGITKTTDIVAGGITFERSFSTNEKDSASIGYVGVHLNRKSESNPIVGDYTSIGFPYLTGHTGSVYMFALAPDAVPTEPSVIVNATDRHVTWKPLSEFGTSNLSLLDIYPIGSIYLSVNSTSPAILFGGTWEQIKDRFLLAAGDTYSAGLTGGEANHTLTESEMPKHSHNLPVDKAYGQEAPTHYDRINLTSGTVYNNGYASNATGGNQAHNNMPPYLTVYMWKRVS